MEPLWFYASPDSSSKVGPVTQNELQRLIAVGTVTNDYLVWTEGMTDWRKIGEVPSLTHPTMTSTPPLTLAKASIPPTLLAVPHGMRGWMTFGGVMNIVFGILSLFTCIGFINGVLAIVAGTALLGACSALLPVQSEGADWPTFLSKLKTYMLAQGILHIITIVAVVFYLALLMPPMNSVFRQLIKALWNP